ncbi:hypothetical protein GCM10023328_16990 [Modestobacter marinus]|uniref:Membrane protein implicated in regulation of membrane protease activity n=1 Tax=Modestobacter marinus TaxID=477641 RepID=A0A846LRQ3_9ACTN|nr:hypothetical protein [Modestobacter marinus]NIH68245.1 membrane protein implicated in regulation of membrane protease activity [Modestobacter marinus]GGL79261.1 hypothetical protein GCM10011589_39250 [Modestobacter marinus]
MIWFLLGVLLVSAIAGGLVAWRARESYIALAVGGSLLMLAVTALFILFVLTVLQ